MHYYIINYRDKIAYIKLYSQLIVGIDTKLALNPTLNTRNFVCVNIYATIEHEVINYNIDVTFNAI